MKLTRDKLDAEDLARLRAAADACVRERASARSSEVYYECLYAEAVVQLGGISGRDYVCLECGRLRPGRLVDHICQKD